MRKRLKEPPYHLTAHLTENRRAKHTAFTLKAARHLAKTLCENDNVVSIDLTGVDIPSTRLYAKGE